MRNVGCKYLFVDKVYLKGDKPLFIENQVETFTPAKKKKWQKFLDSSDKLLSKTNIFY